MALTEQEMNQLADLADKKQFKRLKEELCDMNEVDIAEVLNMLTPEQALVAFRLLPKDLATEAFACLEIEEQQHIINSLEDAELHHIIEDLAIDDAVDMVEELPASVVKRILKIATPTTRQLINQYLQYPDNSAGTIMTAEYVALRPSMTVEEAFAYIRKNGVDKETIYNCYVINPKRQLLGVVTLKDLLMNPYETKVEDIMDDNILSALTTDDQEEVAATFNKYGLLALPVVDKENRLVGIVTIDDVVDSINNKMVRRHPHIFGTDRVADDPEAVLSMWEEIKAAEKKDCSEERRGVMQVNDNLPALMLAEKVQNKAHRVGFDWPDIDGPLHKLKEELTELEAAATKEEFAEELGDVLFAAVNLARFYDVDPEQALRQTVHKFMARFNYVEKRVEEQGLSWSDFNQQQLEAFYAQAKQQEDSPHKA